jgi:hypothetical protein
MARRRRWLAAKGKSASEACAIAGYSPNRRNASVLRQHQDISSRVAELLDEANKMARISTEKATEALAIDREWGIGQAEGERQAGHAGGRGLFVRAEGDPFAR